MGTEAGMWSEGESYCGEKFATREEAVRDAMARFREQVYERAIQLRTEAAQAAFSPSD